MTNLTTTLEKSKELKLAGWSKECKFVYHKIKGFGRKTYVLLRMWNYNDGSLVLNEWPAPTINELLEEMDNNNILDYLTRQNNVAIVYGLIDLFRSPDKLADVYLWGRKEGLIK